MLLKVRVDRFTKSQFKDCSVLLNISMCCATADEKEVVDLGGQCLIGEAKSEEKFKTKSQYQKINISTLPTASLSLSLLFFFSRFPSRPITLFDVTDIH
jgi:hypothetical protein